MKLDRFMLVLSWIYTTYTTYTPYIVPNERTVSGRKRDFFIYHINHNMDTPCCMYGKNDCGFEVFPRGGEWSFQRVHEILMDCQEVPKLAGATINTTGGEGGFSWAGNKESEALWRINTRATTGSVDECGPMQIRTYGVRGVGTSDDD